MREAVLRLCGAPVRVAFEFMQQPCDRELFAFDDPGMTSETPAPLPGASLFAYAQRGDSGTSAPDRDAPLDRSIALSTKHLGRSRPAGRPVHDRPLRIPASRDPELAKLTSLADARGKPCFHYGAASLAAANRLVGRALWAMSSSMKMTGINVRRARRTGSDRRGRRGRGQSRSPPGPAGRACQPSAGRARRPAAWPSRATASVSRSRP
jgi:hypothetical protein